MKFDLSSFNRDSIKKGINFVKNRGLPGVMSRVRYKMSEIGGQYDDWYRLKHEEDEDLLARQRESALSYAPCMSILVSVYMTPEKYLREMIESVIAQTYANWELLLVDGSYANDVAEEFIYVGEAERIIKLYMEREPRIRYKRQDKNPGISANLNAALSAAITISVASARLAPAPAAMPFTAAMIGTGQSSTARSIGSYSRRNVSFRSVTEWASARS